MNPLGWLKPAYEAFGIPYPKASLVVVMILSALIGGGLWLLAAKQVENDHRTSSAPPSVNTGPASTSGDNSPANTGSGNQFQYDNPPKTKP